MTGLKGTREVIYTYAPPPNGRNLHENERFEVRLAADRDRQERGGRDSRQAMTKRRQFSVACLHWVDCNWDERPGELESDFLLAEGEVGM